MSFRELSIKYLETFGEFPPELVTLDTEDELYLKMLNDAIEKGEPLNRNDLANVFMQDKEAVY